MTTRQQLTAARLAIEQLRAQIHSQPPGDARNALVGKLSALYDEEARLFVRVLDEVRPPSKKGILK